MGLVISSLMFLSRSPQQLERFEIEKLARELGMGYKDEFILYEEVNEGSLQGNDEQNMKSEKSEDNSGIRTNVNTGESTEQDGKKTENKHVLIPRGSTTEEIAYILMQAGIISDANAFQRIIDERKLSRKIRAGEYTFHSGEGIEEIIKTITKE